MDKLLFLVLVLQCLYRVFGLYEVSNLGCSASSSTVLVFTWSRPSDPSRNVVGYKLNLQRSDNVKMDVIPEQTVNDYYTETYTFSGLHKYAIYTLKLNTYTSGGNEPDQLEICQTLTDLPAQAPATVEAVGISYSEITVEWTEIGQEYRNGVLLGYKIVYYMYKSSFPQTAQVDNSTLTYKITGLEFDTYYLVGVKGFTSTGDGPTTTDSNKTLGLPTQPPEEVVKYYCYEAIPGLLTISWDSMPCTIYVGAIGFLFTFCCIFGVGCCVACCGKKPPVDPDADMAGGGGGRSNGCSYDNESYYSNDYDEKRHKSAGDITARDVWISSPGPSEFSSEADYYDETAPKSSIMPKIGKDIIEQNKLQEGNHTDSDNPDDEKDSVYFSDESTPGTRQGSVEQLDLADVEEEGSLAQSDNTSDQDDMSNANSDDNNGDDDDEDADNDDENEDEDDNDDENKDGNDDENDGDDDENFSNDENNDGNSPCGDQDLDDIDNQPNDDMDGDGSDVDNNESVNIDNNNSSQHDREDDDKSEGEPNDRLEGNSRGNSGMNKEEIESSESSDDDDIPILFPKKPVEPRVINVKENEQDETSDTNKQDEPGNKRAIFKLDYDDKPVHMAPAHFKMDNLFLCKMRNEGGSKMKQAASKVMTMNKVTNAMQNKGLRKNTSLPNFGAPSRNTVAPETDAGREGLGRNKSIPGGMDDGGLGGENFYKLDSLFLVSKNKQNKNVKDSLNKDYMNEEPYP